MIANLLNCALGLALVYLAVLNLAWIEKPWLVAVGGVLAILLALWARATDFRKWQSNVNLVLGVLLLILAAFAWATGVASVALFWGVFWPGILVAVFALWSVLYRHSSPVELEPAAHLHQP
jgi:hypothetical protein